MCNNFQKKMLINVHAPKWYTMKEMISIHFRICVIHFRWQNMKFSSVRSDRRKFVSNEILNELKFSICFLPSLHQKTNVFIGNTILCPHKIKHHLCTVWLVHQRCDCRENEFLVAFIPSMTLWLWWDMLG